MTIITLSTVGFGEVHKLNSEGMIFTSLLIVSGVITISLLVAVLVKDIVETTVLLDRQTTKRLRKMKNHFIICGGGRVGMEIGRSLHESGKSFVIIDSHPSVIEALRQIDYPYLHGDATSEAILLEAGILHARGIACVLDSDASNLFSCLSAREMKSDIFIIVRSSTDSAVPKFLKAGANRVLNPFTTTANRMAYTLQRPTVVDFLEVASNEKTLDIKIEEVYIPVGSSLDGVKIADSGLRQKENVIAAAIQKTGKRMLFNPSPQEIIQGGDVLIAMGSQESLQALAQRIKTK